MSKSIMHIATNQACLTYWALTVLLHLTPSDIQDEFGLTQYQLNRLRQGYVRDAAPFSDYLRQRAAAIANLHPPRSTIHREYLYSLTKTLRAVAQHHGLTETEHVYHPRTAEAAMVFLREHLPGHRSTIRRRARDLGYQWKTLRRAAVLLGVDVTRPDWSVDTDDD